MSLSTKRLCFIYGNGVIFLDENSYLNKVDYELEYEAKTLHEGKNEFIKLLESKLPEGLTYSKLNPNEKGVIKGMYTIYSDAISSFEYRVITGFPTPNDKALKRMSRNVMESFKEKIIITACDYILSTRKDDKDEKKA